MNTVLAGHVRAGASNVSLNGLDASEVKPPQDGSNGLTSSSCEGKIAATIVDIVSTVRLVHDIVMRLSC
ncbi:hypothetical protein I3J27_33145 [Bradyrhizobium xenonodulans]|uniref:Uncharacterized protein n=1 Tax=Bradyrhizobium xenonodulans TaxID=2736875 RepID=A0ABY7MHZ1_9BRAD|nr:hypothetical protein [Bradyrhizobium xenonodulans]WBL77804.1 hypothetical protein I3J27_33145 [Bradyrhizobium xenonodulans]